MICNSSPLICLAKINQLEILKKLYKNIIITPEVKNEILVSDKPGYSVMEIAMDDNWIKIMNPKSPVNFGLDPGENSVLNLAKETNQGIIIDDEKAIKIANSLKIKILRTTSIILEALNKKIINKKQAKLYINQIVEQGYYISPHYYSRLLQAIEDYKD